MNKKYLKYLLLVIFVCGLAVSAEASIIADSENDFSGIQGQDNWYYGYYDTATDEDGSYNPLTDFTQFTFYGILPSFNGEEGWAITDKPSPWTSIMKSWSHPEGNAGSSEQRAIRRWKSTYSGSVTIKGRIAHYDDGDNCGDNFEGMILVDNRLIYSQKIENTDATGVSYSVNAEIQEGSLVDFFITVGNGDYKCDHGLFTAVIYIGGESVPETTESDYDSGYEAGKKYCINNPSACGITTGSGGMTDSDHDGVPDEWDACFTISPDGNTAVDSTGCAVSACTKGEQPDGSWAILFPDPGTVTDANFWEKIAEGLTTFDEWQAARQ